jgi:hypothetical protein
MRSEQRTQGKIKYREGALKHGPEDCWGQGPLGEKRAPTRAEFAVVFACQIFERG